MDDLRAPYAGAISISSGEGPDVGILAQCVEPAVLRRARPLVRGPDRSRICVLRQFGLADLAPRSHDIMALVALLRPPARAGATS